MTTTHTLYYHCHQRFDPQYVLKPIAVTTRQCAVSGPDVLLGFAIILLYNSKNALARNPASHFDRYAYVSLLLITIFTVYIIVTECHLFTQSFTTCYYYRLQPG